MGVQGSSYISLSESGLTMPRESEYQAGLIRRIEKRFPGAIVLKNDPSYKQGVPDILILLNDKWATLEVKNSKKARHQPNQDYYVGLMSEMSYSSFIYPENEGQVLDELQRALGA